MARFDAARAVVFDLDGTLIDSEGDIVAAMNHTLRRHDRAALPRETIASYVGDGARALVQRAAGLSSADPALDVLLADFLEYYTAHATDHTRLMAGAAEALAALSHLPLALCTNKARATTEAVLRALFPDDPFRVIVAGGDPFPPKPDPGCLLFIAAELGVRPEELVMVGDGVQDVRCAHAAGSRSIALCGGFTDSDRLRAEAPTALAATLMETVALVARFAAAPHATSV